MNALSPGRIYLLLDAASPLVQTGLLQDGRWIEWRGSREEAGRSLFEGVATIFRNHEIGLDQLNGFLFCEGPGSMLGIRIAAMAIRGWQALLSSPLPVFAYSSHELLARMLLADSAAVPFLVLSDARRDRWNVTRVDERHNIGPLLRLSANEVFRLDEARYRMEEKLLSQPPGEATKTVPYSMENHAGRFLEPGLLRQAPTAEPLIQQPPEYKKWNADRHR
jgi:tRNA threonylcarbamoyladenosine biosynthesis protein TsaB